MTWPRTTPKVILALLLAIASAQAANGQEPCRGRLGAGTVLAPSGLGPLRLGMPFRLVRELCPEARDTIAGMPYARALVVRLPDGLVVLESDEEDEEDRELAIVAVTSPRFATPERISVGSEVNAAVAVYGQPRGYFDDESPLPLVLEFPDRPGIYVRLRPGMPRRASDSVPQLSGLRIRELSISIPMH